MPVAFSYIRFSTPAQSQGDSLRRQKQLAVDYCERNGLTLDPRSYVDLGVSAYEGKNAKEGALSVFLQAVDDKVIPSDLWLLVESLDRISRGKPRIAVSLFLRILEKGITIVSLLTGQVYKPDNSDDDNGAASFALMMAVMEFGRAHNESSTKSKRLSAAWSKKRLDAAQTGKLLTKICPAWMHINEAGDGFDLIEDEANKVRKMFEMIISGVGAHTIGKTFTKQGIVTPKGKPWSSASIVQKLRMKACIGIKDVEPPIPNYYPRIVSDEVFFHANQILDNRRTGGLRGQTMADEKVSNLFAGKLVCGLCGATGRTVSGYSKYNYFQCRTSYETGNCSADIVNAISAEKEILVRLFIAGGFVRVHTTTGDNDKVLAVIKSNEDKIGKLTVSLGLVDDNTPLVNAMNALQRENKELRERIEAHPVTTVGASYARALKAYSAYMNSASHPQVLQSEITQQRRLLQAELSRLIDRVIISPAAVWSDDKWWRTITIEGPIIDYIGDEIPIDEDLNYILTESNIDRNDVTNKLSNKVTFAVNPRRKRKEK
jgi:DNA invertase Pin-like site-specific DNA recombinase